MDLNPNKGLPVPSLFPGSGYPITNNLLRGIGQLTWLSSKGGLITIKNTPIGQKQEAVTDLTSVLRVGFHLYFQATPSFDNQTWIATHIAPVSDQDQFQEHIEIDLEYFEKNCEKPNNFVPKDSYVMDIEKQAVMFMLSLFQKNAQTHMPLPSVHSKISNSGNEEMYSYIGSSSLKRRHFLDKRSYVMGVTEGEIVYLQHPDTYTTVLLLTKYLLTHGGVTPLDKLFTFFCSTSEISVMLKEHIKSPAAFTDFLARHDFIFSIFPSKFFVSVRHNLPSFDYVSYIEANFPHTQLPVFINSSTVIYLNTTARSMPTPPYNVFDVLSNNSKNITNGAYMPSLNKNNFHDESLKTLNPINTRINTMNNNGIKGLSQNTGWPNDVGYFDNVSQQPIFGLHNNNNMMTPIIGRNTSIEMLNRNPSELSLMNSGHVNGGLALARNSSIESNMLSGMVGAMQSMQINKFSNTATQTEGALRTSGCVCKCTCGNAGNNQMRKSPENMMGMFNSDCYSTNSKLEDNIMQLQNQFSDSLRQRSFSVQEQALFPMAQQTVINGQIQRPLFSSIATASRATTNSSKLPSEVNFFSSCMPNIHGETKSSKNTSPNGLNGTSISPIFDAEKAFFESRLNLPVSSANKSTLNSASTYAGSLNNDVNNSILSEASELNLDGDNKSSEHLYDLFPFNTGTNLTHPYSSASLANYL